MPTTAEPLIWTTKGNLPVASLRYETAWHDDEKQVIFRERYYLDDELVRQNVHTLLREGQQATGEQAIL